MRRVVIESPYAGDVVRNAKYARRCVLDSLRRGEAPFLSRLFYTQVLDDKIPADRALGIEAGLAWAGAADATILYTDYGVSVGMSASFIHARSLHRCVEERTIGQNPFEDDIIGDLDDVC